MSQNDLGNMSSPLSGASFIDSKLEPWRDTLHTSHSGSSRPSYAVAGMLWLNTTTTPWVWTFFDGSDDIPLCEFNATTNLVGLRAATIGANATQRHTVPAVASDTIALLDAAQTLTNKTLSNNINALTVRNTANFNVTSSTTLADVTGLSVNVTAGATYKFTAKLFATATTTEAVRAGIGGTCTATSVRYIGNVYSLTVSAFGNGVTTFQTSLGNTAANLSNVSAAVITIDGTITVNTAGTLTVMFAQNTSGASVSSVLANSTFELVRIA